MKKTEHWNTEQVRQYNQSLVLKVIYKHGPISKTEISERTKLTFAAIGNITSALLNVRVVTIAGYGKSNGGRRPLLYEFNWDQYYVVALDIGVTKISAALVNFKGVIYEQCDIIMSSFKDSPSLIERAFITIDRLISLSMISPSKIVGIGVSAPGPIDEEGGEILTPPNLDGVENVNIKKMLENRYNLATILEKDANAAALAEQWFGTIFAKENILYIFADQGIGGGLIVDSRIYRGFKSSAGEIGHTSVDIHGPRCNCGNVGCLEAVASGISIIKRVKQEIHKGGESSLKDLYLQDKESLTLEVIVQHGKRGNQLVRKILDETGYYLGIGVSNAINFFAPTKVIFGGQMIELLPEIIQVTEEVAKSRAFSTFASDIKFIKSSFEDKSCLLGAASIIQQGLFDSPENVLIKTL